MLIDKSVLTHLTLDQSSLNWGIRLKERKEKLTRRKCRIQHIDIDTDIHVPITHAVFYLLEYPLHADDVDVPCRDHAEAAAHVVADVAVLSD